MKFTVVTFILLLLIHPLNAQNSVFLDFDADEFLFQGRKAIVVKPKVVNQKKHWIWRARFWGHEPQLDKALLDVGFHVVYVDIANLFGNNESIKVWNGFYDFVRQKYSLNKKVVLEGMSRGGLIVFNWAARNSEKVACIYADAPVCDIRSWPGGKFSGKGSEADWQKCLNAHSISVESAVSYKQTPLYTCIPVAKANVPTIFVCGDADDVVPFTENTKLVIETMKANGASPKLILKEGVGHQPHSLADPTPIKDFIIDSLK